MRVYPQLKGIDRLLGTSEVANVNVLTMIKVEGLCQVLAALVGSLVAFEQERASQDPVAVIPNEKHAILHEIKTHGITVRH